MVFAKIMSTRSSWKLREDNIFLQIVFMVWYQPGKTWFLDGKGDGVWTYYVEGIRLGKRFAGSCWLLCGIGLGDVQSVPTSVEYVMLELIKAVTPGQLASLKHVDPSFPEVFGYKRLHCLEKCSIQAKTSSLNVLQRLLGYCC